MSDLVGNPEDRFSHKAAHIMHVHVTSNFKKGLDQQRTTSAGRPTWTDCDEAGDYVVPNVLSPRDLVSRTDNMDETVPHTHTFYFL